MQRRRFLQLGAAAIASAGAAGPPAWAQPGTIVVGGKDFTEQLIITSITAQLLTANGFKVDRRDGMGSSVVRQAMENGQIDVYWEYTGTALLDYNKVREIVPAAQVYQKVRTLDAARGIVWPFESKANNTFVLVMTRERARSLGLKSMSDMAKAIRAGTALIFACDPEFTHRPDGLRHVESSYGFQFGRSNVRIMQSGLACDAVHQGRADVAMAFATDGRIPAWGLLGLDDDKRIFPVYDLAPCVLRRTLDANPGIAVLLGAVSARLDTDTMARLNAAVDVDSKGVDAVARGFLTDRKLI